MFNAPSHGASTIYTHLHSIITYIPTSTHPRNDDRLPIEFGQQLNNQIPPIHILTHTHRASHAICMLDAVVCGFTHVHFLFIKSLTRCVRGHAVFMRVYKSRREQHQHCNVPPIVSKENCARTFQYIWF